MNIKTSHNCNGWLATDQDTGITATASFEEGEKQAVKNCKTAVKQYVGDEPSEEDSVDEKG